MQRTSGNVSVQRLLGNDHRPPTLGFIARTCSCGGTPGPSGECDACRAQRLSAQRQADEEGLAALTQRAVEGDVQRAAVVQRNPNPQLCLKWRKHIMGACWGGPGFHNGLEKRYYDMLNDRELWFRYRSTNNPHPTKGSWDGHVEQYLGQQAGLVRKLNAWDRAKCHTLQTIPDLPKEVDDWAVQAPPARPKAAVRR